MIKGFYLGLLILLFTQCGSVSSISNSNLTGDWKLTGDKISVIDLDSEVEIYKKDTTLLIRNKITTKSTPPDFNFSHHSLDIDLIYMPLKLRPSISGVPLQLNTNLNGQLYLGWRLDLGRLKYNNLVKDQWVLNRKKFAFSSGVILGGGNTFISPTTTSGNFSGEYDGLVVTYGFSTIFAINNLTVGTSVAFDFLTDQHHSIWIYQGKPYLGLVIGMNIN
jgi:hypothetical protein